MTDKDLIIFNSKYVIMNEDRYASRLLSTRVRERVKRDIYSKWNKPEIVCAFTQIEFGLIDKVPISSKRLDPYRPCRIREIIESLPPEDKLRPILINSSDRDREKLFSYLDEIIQDAYLIESEDTLLKEVLRTEESDSQSSDEDDYEPDYLYCRKDIEFTDRQSWVAERVKNRVLDTEQFREILNRKKEIISEMDEEIPSTESDEQTELMNNITPEVKAHSVQVLEEDTKENSLPPFIVEEERFSNFKSRWSALQRGDIQEQELLVEFGISEDPSVFLNLSASIENDHIRMDELIRNCVKTQQDRYAIFILGIEIVVNPHIPHLYTIKEVFTEEEDFDDFGFGFD